MNELIFNIPKCFYSEEIRNGFKISSEMKHVWAVQLEILSEIIRICEKYKLKYFAIGGTLLGAARHKGYIPWDDDLDIAMPRFDYDKFCKIAPGEFRSPFFLQTEETDPGYLLRHAKVRNSNTTGILTSQKDNKYQFNQGIFVDIFPLDKLPDDIDERKVYFNDLYKAWGDVYKYSAYINRNEGCLPENKSLEQIANEARRLNRQYEELASKYANTLSREECILAVTIQSNKIVTSCTWNCVDFDEIEYVPFEFMRIPIPYKYDNILTKQYGDWRTFVIADSLHGEVIFNVNKSYKDFI